MSTTKRRRKSYRTHNRRRYPRRGGGIFAIFSTVAILAAVIVAVTVFFKINEIRVTGESRYADDEIIAASGIETGSNMFFMNKFSAINKMFETLPYLDEVRVRRRLPDTMEIIVSDAVPAAAVESGGGFWLMDKNGKILEKVSRARAQEAAIIVGLSAVEPTPGRVVETADENKLPLLLEFLYEADRAGVAGDMTEIDFSKVYDLRFDYMGRFEVRLGAASDYEKKFRFLQSVISQLASTDVGEIDLSDTSTVRFLPKVG